MKITQKIIDDLEKALDMRKKNGDPVWEDGDEIDVCIGGTFAADKLGIPHTHIKSKNEGLIIDVMKAWKVDLIVLAGWMRILSPKLIEAFPNQIINLHPSMLPKYKGLHAIERALDNGDKMTGVSVHYVNEELDGGEVILQSEVPILPNDDLESLTKAIQRREYYVLPKAIEHVKSNL